MNHAHWTDQQLMQRFCDGDMQAFQSLYQRHELALYRYLRRVLGRDSLSQADDVMQDTWMRMIDARHRWQASESASFKTWLFTLAHHRVVDVLRKSGRELSVDEGWLEESDDAWLHWPAPSHEQPEQQVFWQAAGQKMLDCLHGLPALQRAAFVLHHEDGLSLDEIAQVMNSEFETIKSRLRYALSKLRACMGAYLEPGP